MKRKLSMVILTLTLALCSILGLTACGENEPPAPKYYTVTWQNYDGSILETDDNVKEGLMPTYDSATPTKESDAEFTFEFSEWSPEIKVVDGDITYIAQFSSVKNKYTVTWKDYDGTVLEIDDNVEYGTTPFYDKENPTREKDAQYTYTFSGWNPTVDLVTRNVVYTAQYSTTLNEYTVTWKNYDGTILETDTEVPYGTIPSYNSHTPTKGKDAQYTYTFDSWDKTITAVGGDITYTAIYTSILNRYTVTWKNYDDTILELDEDIEYGTQPTYNGIRPTRERAEYTYTFIGWDKNIAEVTGNVVYTAQYSQEVSKFTVVWKNYDGTVLKIDTDLLYQEMPEYVGQMPTKEKDAQYTYTFNGWSPAISKITDDVVYTAQYSTILNKYTVTWKNYDGTVLETDTEVPYGEMPVYNANTPTKEKDAQYTYSFNGWDKTISTVKGDIIYNAKFSNTVNKYTITWKNYDGSTLKTDSVAYGTQPVYSGTTPYKNNEGLSYEYVFNGWSPTIVNVQCDAIYIAQFSTRELTEFTIKYNANGGVGAPSMQTKNKNVGLTLSTTKPTREGYAFIGWNNAYENKVYQAGDIFEQNFACTLYAMWEQLCEECDGNGYYTIGGRCANCQGRGYFYNCRSCGSAYVQTNVLQWYCYSCQAAVSVNSTVCASCNGDGAIVKTYSCEKYIKQSAPTIKNVGEDFIELNIVDGYEYSKDGINWQTSNLFTGLKSSTTYTFYQRKATCNGIPFGVTSDSVTATTNKATVYSITFDLQGGYESSPNVKTYTFETESIILNNPVKEGYTFIGWTGSNGNSLQMEVVISTGTRGNLNYTANWRINQYTITIVYGNGQENKVITQDYGSKIKETLPESEGERPGYTFMWDNVMPATMPAKNLTITAKWEAIFILNEHEITGLTTYGKTLKIIHIPEKIDGISVTSIGSYAFFDRDSLTSIVIGDSVTSIGSYAFECCDSLTSVTIGDSVTSIGEHAFDDCDGLTSIEIPNGVTSIGKYAFQYCRKLTSIVIGDSVTSIGSYAFQYCNNLTSIAIGKNVTSIGSYAFASCKSLTSIEIPNSVTSIGALAFYNCSKLTNIEMSNSVTSIGSSAFSYCSSLTSIEIPSSVTNMGSSVFDGCNELQYFVKDEIRYLGNSKNPYLYLAGVVSNNITTAIIDDNCKFIGSYAFYKCSSLTSIVIPNGVTSIGPWAFQYCSSLTNIELGDGVTIIGEYTFSDCTALTSIILPNGIRSIPDCAFADCASLTSIEIPNSVTSIGNSAFSCCSSLTSIVIPNSVTSIGRQAFYNCTSLTSATIGWSVITMENEAFYFCTTLKNIKYRGTEEEWQAITKGSGWNSNTGSYTITYNYAGE